MSTTVAELLESVRTTQKVVQESLELIRTRRAELDVMLEAVGVPKPRPRPDLHVVKGGKGA
jgi:hypothetical protein